jgi:hypothetical protein
MIEIRRLTTRLFVAAALSLWGIAASLDGGLAQAPPQRLAPDGAAPSVPVTPVVPGPRIAPPPVQQSPAQPDTQKPGWFDTLGHWFDESVNNMGKGWDNVNKGLQSTWGAGAETTKNAAEAASEMAKGAAEAAGAVGRFSTSHLVAGQSVCAIAPNGAPDCRGAAVSLCKANGFKSGTSVDYVTAEKCPSEAYLGEKNPARSECTIEHTVTRALCQ